MFEMLYYFYFACFLIAIICAPIMLGFSVMNILAKDKKRSVITIILFILCVVIYLSYASPDYSKTKFSDSTIDKASEITTEIDKEGVWEKSEENQDSRTCFWVSETSVVYVNIYPHKESLLNAADELYIDRNLSFLLLGKEEERDNLNIAIYPRIIYRDFLELVPDYADTEIEILADGMVIYISMHNKFWKKKDDVAINEFLSDFFDGTNYGEFSLD